ncbi:MAG TPA: hypothetical protein VNZ22_01030 [Bacillota bacterium]|nr:hypothetical protein [Bacillota bacterium]
MLQWVRSQPQFRQLPIVVLTASSLPTDKDRAAALGATAFLTKSFNWTEVSNTLHQVLLQHYAPAPGSGGLESRNNGQPAGRDETWRQPG